MEAEKKMGDGQRDPKEPRQRMQKKDNAPCNNQLERTKRKRKTQKEGNLPPRKLSPKKCFQKNPKQKNPPSASKRRGSNKIPQVPPKEQEAKKSPKCLQKNRKQQNPPPPFKPIHSQ
jgi:hypothetical protein